MKLTQKPRNIILGNLVRVKLPNKECDEERPPGKQSVGD